MDHSKHWPAQALGSTPSFLEPSRRSRCNKPSRLANITELQLPTHRPRPRLRYMPYKLKLMPRHRPRHKHRRKLKRKLKLSSLDRQAERHRRRKFRLQAADQRQRLLN